MFFTPEGFLPKTQKNILKEINRILQEPFFRLTADTAVSLRLGQECLSLAAQVAELRSAQTSAQLEAELRSGHGGRSVFGGVDVARLRWK